MENIGPDVNCEKAAFIHSSALMYGKVNLNEGVSIWPNVVIRSESEEVEIGAYSNIQDFVMIHVGYTTGTYIGVHCSITHHCTIHGATIGDNCLIGMGSTIMDECVIGDNCIIAGGSFLKERTIIPENSIVMGTPGKVVRTQNNWVTNRHNAWMYYKNATHYAKGLYRAWADEDYEKDSKAELEKLKKQFEDRV